MPYTPTSWVNGTTAVSAAHMNNIETVYTEATNSFEQDLFTAFIYSGLVCSIDGSIANQLDVTAGVAFLLQTDSTLRRRANSASTTGQFTTSTASTTYFLDLNPDGTFHWGTSHSGVSNYLTICSATTNSGGNLLVVTDARTLNTTMLTNMLGSVVLPNGFSVLGTTSLDNGAITTDGAGNITKFANITSSTSPLYKSRQSGGTSGHIFKTWNGTAGVVPFSIAAQLDAALAWVDNSGNYNGPVSGGIPTTRLISATWTALNAPIYTGASAPTATQLPPTGAIFIEA